MKLEKIIVFMGPPGSGKGTQTELLAKKLGFAYFSTGALSREYAAQDTELGRRIKELIDNGIILPIDIIQQIFVKKFEELVDSPGIILDGYPRTIEQAMLLDELLKKYQIRELKAIFLEVDKQRLVERIKLRGVQAGRADDDPAVIENRFDQYINKTAPVKQYYADQGLLVEINGDQDVEAVHKEIMEKIT